MNRAYLHEDVRLIRRYFPGAKTVALHTPFDLTSPPETDGEADPWKLRADLCDDASWSQSGDLLWSR